MDEKAHGIFFGDRCIFENVYPDKEAQQNRSNIMKHDKLLRAMHEINPTGAFRKPDVERALEILERDETLSCPMLSWMLNGCRPLISADTCTTSERQLATALRRHAFLVGCRRCAIYTTSQNVGYRQTDRIHRGRRLHLLYLQRLQRLHLQRLHLHDHRGERSGERY